MDWLSFAKSLWNPVSTPLTLAAGALGAQLWQRYLRRLSAFRWSVWHNRLAISGTDPNLGNVEVLWNGSAVTNLYFCNIEFENESSQDFSDVEVKFWYADGSHFLGQGNLTGTAQFLPWAHDYGELLHRLLSTPPDQQSATEMQHAITHREYRIPVFNRGSKFNLTFVVHSNNALIPYLSVACDHKGVKLLQRTQRPEFFGVVQTHAAWVGMAAGLVVTTAMGLAVATSWIAAVVGFFIGAFGTFLGLAIIRLKRWIVRSIG